MVQTLAKEYNKTEKCIYNDWGRRHKWIPQIMQLEDPTFVLTIIKGLEEIIRHGWAEYSNVKGDPQQGLPPNPPAVRIGALKIVSQTYKDIIQLAQSVGYVPKVKEQVDVGGDVTIHLDYGITSKDPTLFVKKVKVETANSKAEQTEIQMRSRQTS